MRVPVELAAPRMPNFITVRGLESDRNSVPRIAVRDLTEEQAGEYAQVMRDAFLAHWHKKVNEPEEPRPR